MQNLSIKFYLLKSKTNKAGEAPVYCRISIGKSINLSTDIFLNPSDWDSKKSKIKNKHPRSQAFNNAINDLEKKIYSIYDELKFKGEIISVDAIKMLLKNNSQKKESLINLYDYFIEYAEQRLNSGYSKGRIAHYKTNKRKMITFLTEKYRCADIHLEKLDFEFITRYESFLLNKYKNHVNHVDGEIKRVKAIIHCGLRLGWLKADPFKSYVGKTIPTNRQFLSEEEVRRIEVLEVSENRHLTIVKDMFLFMTYTGISYSDLANLSQENITIGNKSFIELERQKTNESSVIPLLDKAWSLIGKYKNDPIALNRGRIFPVFSNQKINKSLKVIADMAKISKPLTCHIARHSFATIALENGTPLETVSRVLGHSNIKTTQIYAKVTKSKIDKDFEGLSAIFGNNIGEGSIN